jgi:hypothetical protein
MPKAYIINYEKKIEGQDEPYKGSVTMNGPTDVDEACQMYGGETVLQKAMAQIVIDARRICYNAETPEEAQELVSKWTPGVSRQRTGGVSKKAAAELLSEFSSEDIAAIIAEIKARKGE